MISSLSLALASAASSLLAFLHLFLNFRQASCTNSSCFGGVYSCFVNDNNVVHSKALSQTQASGARRSWWAFVCRNHLNPNAMLDRVWRDAQDP